MVITCPSCLLVKVKVLVAQLCPLFATPWSAHRIPQARVREWITIPFSQESS